MPASSPLRNALLALLIGAAPLVAQDEHRIWGSVETVSGEVLEGFIRWDRNEGSWVDVLDGGKDVPDHLYESWREAWEAGERPTRTVEMLGYRISWNEDDPEFPQTAASGIRFGHLASLRVTASDRAELALKSGEVVEFVGGSTDLGWNMRELIVEEPGRGETELVWDSLRTIDFSAPPPGRRASASRLYGTVEDRSGRTFTGYVSWDLDEILGSDVLDGEEDGQDREIPFEDIRVIERHLGGANVTLRSGRELYLRGSNDVGRGHRGLQISDPLLGGIEVEWEEFESMRFEEPPAPVGYEAFDGGRPLFGTIVTQDDEEIRGFIRWHGNKERDWELLSGSSDEVAFRVELSHVDRIVRGDLDGATVYLKDGRTFELESAFDFGWDNWGIFVKAVVEEAEEEGDAVEAEWRLLTWDDLQVAHFEPVPETDTVEGGSR